MYKSVFSMLIAAKADEIKSNPTRTEILSEKQWLRKLIDGKKPIELPRYKTWRPLYFRPNKDPNELQTLVPSLLQGINSSDFAQDLVPGFLEGWFETIEDKPDYVSRDTFLRVREFVTLGYHNKKILSSATMGHHFSKIYLKRDLQSEQRRNEVRPVTVKVVRGGWKKLVYANGDEEWDPV